jgi:serine/threonine protein phosphatase PrpC
MQDAPELKISAGQCSDKGRKETNQDFHGLCVPKEPQLGAKGIAVALADGISSSSVSDVASQYAVAGFLEDYYCTSGAWTVKTSAERILSATNSWLHAQTRKSPYRYDKEKGYVCTLSAMVLKSATAHIFHVGDSRIYRLRGKALEQLTSDHRVWIAQGQSHLARALGIQPQLEIDYQAQPLEEGDIFLLATDGVYEHVSEHDMAAIIRGAAIGEGLSAFDGAARTLVDTALRQGSGDNLTAQVIRIDALPRGEAGEMARQLAGLPLPPILDARTVFEGYTIVRELHGSSRSHIYLATDGGTGERVVLKTPSIDLGGDPAYLERFLTEEWIARRIHSAHVLKAHVPTRQRHHVYVATEYIEGQTLAQWMTDNPRPALEAVRGIVEQIAKGLRAFHRLEMLHQDLRPENIMIDSTGTAKIIDFGATCVASLMEAAPDVHPGMLGTAQYSAPEYFLGEGGSPRSDLFSLGIITYQMLTGRLPYGAEVAKCRTRAAQNQLRYDSALRDDREIPAWVDGALRKAVHPNPGKRYGELSEFVYDLRHPNQAFLGKTRQPLLERNPVAFWKGLALLLAAAIVVMAALKSVT